MSVPAGSTEHLLSTKLTQRRIGTTPTVDRKNDIGGGRGGHDRREP